MDYSDFYRQVKPLFPGVVEGFGIMDSRADCYCFAASDLYRSGDGYHVSFNPVDCPDTPWCYGEKQLDNSMVHGQGDSLEEALANYKSQVEVVTHGQDCRDLMEKWQGNEDGY